jgi:putative transposase
MPMKKYKPEQIVTLLRQVEVELANGKTTPQACKEAEITAQTYYRWRKEFGGLKLDQAKRLKELERENAKLKRLVAELSLEKQILKDVAERNFQTLSGDVEWSCMPAGYLGSGERRNAAIDECRAQNCIRHFVSQKFLMPSNIRC